MLDTEDLKWIAATSTDLNSILQQITRYSDLARRHQGNYNYLDLLLERVDLASKAAQALFDRVTSNILANTAGRAAGQPNSPLASFVVLPTPTGPGTPPSMAASGDFSKLIAPLAQGLQAKREFSTGAVELKSDFQVRNSKGNRELILIIEDENEVAELASDMLTEEGYKVILASDGFEALKIYEKVGKKIGLIILDYFLPVMDGDAVFDELRVLNPDINVVLSSGFAEQAKISSMLAQGLRGFIPKPYTQEKLLAQVRLTLDASRQSLAPR